MFRSSLDTLIKPILCPRKSGPIHFHLILMQPTSCRQDNLVADDEKRVVCRLEFPFAVGNAIARCLLSVSSGTSTIAKSRLLSQDRIVRLYRAA